MMYVWTQRAPHLTGPAGALSHAVYGTSLLSLREFEAARIAIARVNDCNVCLGWRSAVTSPARPRGPTRCQRSSTTRYSSATTSTSRRERLCAEFATKFVVDHLSIDDAMWSELHVNFTDDELVDLALCVGAWIAFGRLNRVFDVDGACRVGAPLPG